MRFVFFSIIVLLSLKTEAQFDSTLKMYNDKFIQEKVYVHFDKSFYSAGETIWFKAYLLAGNQNTGISNSFFAELIDLQGNILERKIFPISGPSAYGDFLIPKNFKEKQLIFRGYTTWMLNFDTTFLFTKTIDLYQPNSLINSSLATNINKTELKFFPEGGDLIEGLTSVLAFKATNQSGFPVALAGVIKDNSGKHIDSFKTVHDGMGYIKFLPASNLKYYAEWKDDKDVIQKTELPQVKEDGIVIESSQNSLGQHILISRRENANDRFKVVYLVAQMNSHVVFKARANLSVFRSVKGTIHIDSLSTGILQLTVFDESWQPLAERISFINKNDRIFKTLVNVELKDTFKRKKNIVEIEIPSDVSANLSVSITDSEIDKKDPYSNNIISGLLLLSNEAPLL